MPITIDTNKCNGASQCDGDGLCTQLCEQGALTIIDDQIQIDESKCDDCDVCIANCPNEAINKK